MSQRTMIAGLTYLTRVRILSRARYVCEDLLVTAVGM